MSISKLVLDQYIIYIWNWLKWGEKRIGKNYLNGTKKNENNYMPVTLRNWRSYLTTFGESIEQTMNWTVVYVFDKVEYNVDIGIKHVFKLMELHHKRITEDAASDSIRTNGRRLCDLDVDSVRKSVTRKVKSTIL